MKLIEHKRGIYPMMKYVSSNNDIIMMRKDEYRVANVHLTRYYLEQILQDEASRTYGSFEECWWMYQSKVADFKLKGGDK